MELDKLTGTPLGKAHREYRKGTTVTRLQVGSFTPHNNIADEKHASEAAQKLRGQKNASPLGQWRFGMPQSTAIIR
jgi:hypothetical protein